MHASSFGRGRARRLESHCLADEAGLPGGGDPLLVDAEGGAGDGIGMGAHRGLDVRRPALSVMTAPPAAGYGWRLADRVGAVRCRCRLQVALRVVVGCRAGQRDDRCRPVVGCRTVVSVDGEGRGAESAGDQGGIWVRGTRRQLMPLLSARSVGFAGLIGLVRSSRRCCRRQRERVRPLILLSRSGSAAERSHRAARCRWRDRCPSAAGQRRRLPPMCRSWRSRQRGRRSSCRSCCAWCSLVVL